MKSTKIYVVVPEWLKGALQKSADAKGVTLSEFIRDALKETLSQEKK